MKAESVEHRHSGEACCDCGARVTVVCSGGCANPDIQFRNDLIGSLPGAKGRETRTSTHWKRKPIEKPPGICTYLKCTDPVAPRRPGKGRPPKRCVKHLEYHAQFVKPRMAA